MKVIHYDLFAGIGGFSYAIDQVYGKENTKHIFVEIDPFCQAVLKKHWPEGEYWGDIREFITHTAGNRCNGWSALESRRQNKMDKNGETKEDKQNRQRRECKFGEVVILTGGFPCQPFSQAGKRRGTQDNRYLWPEMFRVIQLVKPQIVVAENVYGLLTIEGGLVFEQVCADLEAEGYEIQPLIIPAVSVNAPHRRDRVWIVAYAKGSNNGGKLRDIPSTDEAKPRPQEQYQGQGGQFSNANLNASNSTGKRLCGGCENKSRQQSGMFGQDIQQNASNSKSGQSGKQTKQEGRESFSRRDWERDWKEVAFERCVCELDDGLSRRMVRLPDGTRISYAKWRREALKSFGNAIVPQVAIEILKAINFVGN